MGRIKPRPGCEGCIHVSYQGGCDYLLHTGHGRGCPPGEGCVVKDTGKRAKPGCQLPPDRVGEWSDRYWRPSKPTPSAVALENDETALRLYAAGASDPEIARATGWGVSTVRSWRRRTGRPANPKRKKDRHGSENNEPQGGAG